MTTTREDFWTPDGDDIEHFHGNHWGVFFPDPGEILPEFLPLILQQGAVWVDRMTRPLPGSPPAALLRHGIDQGQALAMIEAGSDSHELTSCWPMLADVGTHRLTLRRGHLWPNRLEAQLEAGFGPSSVTFFDHGFLANADTYRAGMQARFHLCIHAYLLELADNTPIVIDDPHWSGREFMTPDDPDDPTSPITIRREGMAAFFQGKESDRDDCEFRGPVKAVRELDGDAFGQRTWILTVTVMRDTDAVPEDIDLDIVLTGLVLGERPLPQVGDDVQGTGWVQGWLASDDRGIA